VFDATLEDLLAPAFVTGKRYRCRLDGSKLFKIHLDSKDQDYMEKRCAPIASLYKKITTRDIAFEFKNEKPFYDIKK